MLAYGRPIGVSLDPDNLVSPYNGEGHSRKRDPHSTVVLTKCGMLSPSWHDLHHTSSFTKCLILLLPLKCTTLVVNAGLGVSPAPDICSYNPVAEENVEFDHFEEESFDSFEE